MSKKSKVGNTDHENTKDLRLATDSHRQEKAKDIITKARKEENTKEKKCPTLDTDDTDYTRSLKLLFEGFG